MPTITYAQALNLALREEMQADPRVFIMGEDIGHHGGIFRVTKDLIDEFGAERIRDTPISESGFTGVAIGAAMAGMRPVVELLFMDFALVAADQIINQAAKLRYMSGGQVSVPIVIRGQQGGGRGNGAQHSQSFESWFAQVPGLKIVAPATPYDAKGLLKSAIREANPVIFIEHKLLYNIKGEVPDTDYTVPIGQAEVKRPGSDVTIVAYSRCVHFALEAAETLAARGIEAEVHRPAHHRAAGHGRHHPLGARHRPAADRARSRTPTAAWGRKSSPACTSWPGDPGGARPPAGREAPAHSGGRGHGERRAAAAGRYRPGGGRADAIGQV